MIGDDEKGDINEEFTTSISDTKKSKIPLKKLFLIGGISLAVILIIIIIIIIVVSSSSSKSKKIGEINCIFDIKTINEETNILGEEFNKNLKFDIIIDGKKIKFAKSYKFAEAKEYLVQFALYEDINMDNMFKNIQDVLSVEMLSNNKNKTKILSMISTFENCNNFKSLNITGYDMSKIKSMYKLFYNSALTDLYFETLILKAFKIFHIC